MKSDGSPHQTNAQKTLSMTLTIHYYLLTDNGSVAFNSTNLNVIRAWLFIYKFFFFFFLFYEDPAGHLVVKQNAYVKISTILTTISG